MANARSVSLSLERLRQILPAAYVNHQRLVLALELMLQYRIDTLLQLYRVANELDGRHHKCNIAKITGSAVGAAGSATAATGIALLPFTAGISSVLIACGGTAAALGTATAFGAGVAEKVHERVGLEKVQQAVDRDRQQCERVSQLWKEFDSYCTNVIITIALADPLRESDVASLQTWVQVALENVTSPVLLIAETFHEEFSGTQRSLSTPDADVLVTALCTMAQSMIGNPVTAFRSTVSFMYKNFSTLAMTAAFLMIATIGLGNVYVFFTTLMDMHKGSHSNVAKELRKTAGKLKEELDTWLGVFGQ